MWYDISFRQADSSHKLIKLAFHFKCHGSTAHFMYVCAVRHLTLCHFISFLFMFTSRIPFALNTLQRFSFFFTIVTSNPWLVELLTIASSDDARSFSQVYFNFRVHLTLRVSHARNTDTTVDLLSCPVNFFHTKFCKFRHCWLWSRWHWNLFFICFS